MAVGGPARLRVVFLERFHRLEAQWGGGVVQAQHIGGQVHGDPGAGGRVPPQRRHQAGQHRAHAGGHAVGQTALFGQPEQAAPQGQHADQSQAHFHRQVGRFPERRHHTGRRLQIAAQQLHQGTKYPDQKKGGKKTMHWGLMNDGKALSMSINAAFAYPCALAPAPLFGRPCSKWRFPLYCRGTL